MTNQNQPERKVIKGDDRFEAFRQRLADKVTIALNVYQYKIGKGEGEYCPIGATVHMRQPSGGIARNAAEWIKDLPQMAPSAFMDGFDGNSDTLSNPYPYSNPYYELGKLYRERFIK